MSAALASVSEPSALGSSLSFTVPLAELGEFAGLAERRRTEVNFTLSLLKRVSGLVAGGHSLEAACQAVAAGSRHAMRGCSAQTLRRKFETYAEAGDWRSLVKGYRGPNTQPREFQLEVKRVSQLNQCSVTEALTRLRERWAAGEAIPGYGTWVDHFRREHPLAPLPKVWPRGFFPTGWHVRNLRRYASSKGARKLFQRGLAAAKQHFPSLTRDPAQLRPLELVVIDDFELDCLCAFPGDADHKPQIGRVAGLLAMDVATRRKLHWGLGQRLERDERAADGTVRTVRTGIARIDVQLLLHGLFEKFGLPDYVVTILCENAAAAIAPELELSISTLFNGRVRIERTGLIEHRNLTNGFVERGGKPWEKGWIEAAFAKLWNILGDQRGYKGNNMRLNAPGDLDAKIRYTKVLLGQGERALNLPPEKIAALRLPFLSPAELAEAFAWACAVADTRTEHRYLGFDRVTEFSLGDGTEPQPFAALALLPPDAQTQVKLIERMESTTERWARLAAGVNFTAIKPEALAVFLLTPKRAVWRNQAISFVHQRGGKREGFSYVDATGEVMANVAEGTEFLCYLNPAAPGELHITAINGALTGTLTRLGGARGMVDIRDKEALKVQAALQAAIVNRTVRDNRELHEEQAVREQAEREHNAAIATGHATATAGQTTVEKIAAAAGEAEARAHAARKAAQHAARPMPAHGGTSLDDLTGEAEPLAPVAAPEREDDEATLDDI